MNMATKELTFTMFSILLWFDLCCLCQTTSREDLGESSNDTNYELESMTRSGSPALNSRFRSLIDIVTRFTQTYHFLLNKTD